MDKKVILINRPLVRVKGLKVPSRKWQPLDSAYIAAILEKENVRCKIVDARALDLTVDDVIEEVKRFQPDLVVFATDPVDFYQCPNPNWQTLKDVVVGIKKVTNAKILSFGPQINLFEKELMYQLKIDFAVKGDNPLLSAEVALDILNQVMNEIKTLVKDFNIETIFFFDEIFTFNRNRVIDLCQRIIDSRYSFKWGCQSRIDFIDEELLRVMHQAGCRYISYGIESGSQRIVDLANKKINLIKAGDIIELTRKVGIFPHTNMMYGFPQETDEDFKKSIDFLIKHSEEDNMPSKMNFFVGSPYYNEYLTGATHQEAVAISQKLILN